MHENAGHDISAFLIHDGQAATEDEERKGAIEIVVHQRKNGSRKRDGYPSGKPAYEIAKEDAPIGDFFADGRDEDDEDAHQDHFQRRAALLEHGNRQLQLVRQLEGVEKPFPEVVERNEGEIGGYKPGETDFHGKA